MKIEIIFDGKPTSVTKPRLLELLSQGQAGLDMPINVDGKLTTVRAVFEGNLDNVPPTNEARSNETNTGTSKGQSKLATARTIFDSKPNATPATSLSPASNPDFFDTKQKCQAIGGVLLAIGCVLFVIAYNLASHNRELINDYNHASRRSDVETWQLQHTSRNDSKELQQKFKDSYNAGCVKSKAVRKEEVM